MGLVFFKLCRLGVGEGNWGFVDIRRGEGCWVIKNNKMVIGFIFKVM